MGLQAPASPSPDVVLSVCRGRTRGTGSHLMQGLLRGPAQVGSQLGVLWGELPLLSPQTDTEKSGSRQSLRNVSYLCLSWTSWLPVSGSQLKPA